MASELNAAQRKAANAAVGHLGRAMAALARVNAPLPDADHPDPALLSLHSASTAAQAASNHLIDALEHLDGTSGQTPDVHVYRRGDWVYAQTPDDQQRLAKVMFDDGGALVRVALWLEKENRPEIRATSFHRSRVRAMSRFTRAHDEPAPDASVLPAVSADTIAGILRDHMSGGDGCTCGEAPEVFYDRELRAHVAEVIMAAASPAAH